MEAYERVETALACAALDRMLGGVLLIGLAPGLVPVLAGRLTRLMPDAPRPTLLGAGTTEQDLWFSPRVDAERGWRYAPGPLVGERRPAGVVAVPDLARLSSAGARAAIATLGAQIAHVERDGAGAVWQPGDRWLAACPRGSVGRLSSHLLDRFALRIDAEALDPADVRGWASDEPAADLRGLVYRQRLARFSEEAADRVIELVFPGGAGSRRDLALARTARALAVFAESAVVRPEHVDAAAELIGLVQPVVDQEQVPVPVAVAPSIGAGEGIATRVAQDVVTTDSVQLLPGEVEPHDAAFFSPYPEDAAGPPSTREPLREPWFRGSDAGGRRGHAVGTERARDPHDVAFTATLLEAAKYQRVRCPDCGRGERCRHGLHLQGRDLRGYRRVLIPGRLLLLVLDHTCRAGWDWFPALSPYLRWGYTVRAAVRVVEVGGAGVADELAATWFEAHGVLDPRVRVALERPAGRATPLAHGLETAARLLKRDTRQGAAATREALLVLVTDGRGNVPLHASHVGRLPARVGADGVRDGLRMAGEIGRLTRVQSVVISPEGRPARHLADALGEALGAVVVAGEGVENGEAMPL